MRTLRFWIKSIEPVSSIQGLGEQQQTTVDANGLDFGALCMARCACHPSAGWLGYDDATLLRLQSGHLRASMAPLGSGVTYAGGRFDPDAKTSAVTWVGHTEKGGSCAP
jgi:hypothetical protein